MSYGKLRNLVASLSSSITLLKSGAPGGVGSAPGVGVIMTAGSIQNTTYNTIAAAVAAATSGDVILLGPGTYNESFTIPSGVIVKGSTVPRDVILAGSSSVGNIVAMSDGSTLREVKMVTPSGNHPAVRYSGSVGGFAICLDLYFEGGGSSGRALQNLGSGRLLCRDINYASGTVGQLFVNSNSGYIVLQDGNQLSGTISETFVNKGNGKFNVRSYEVLTGSIGTGISISGSNSSFVGHNISFNSLSNKGVHVSAESASIFLDGSDIQSTTNDVLIDSSLTGVGSMFSAFDSEFRYEMLSFPNTYSSNANVNVMMHDVGVKNDPTTRFITELSIGSPEIPRESIFGEGDSNVYKMHVFSSSSAGGWVDNTVAAQSLTSSLFSFFGGTTSGSTAYVGHESRTFNGIKVDVVTAMSGAKGLWEYWNSSSWEPFNIMATHADHPYESRNEIAFNVAEDQQIRFGPITGSWATTSVNGQNGYWIRNRLSGAITTDPQFQRIKIGTNRTEINKDGIVEYFGRAEPIRDLIWHKNLEDDLDGSSPSNASITFSSNIAITPVDNRFNDNALDGNGGMVEITDGLDTSKDIYFEVFWRANANGAPSAIELELTTAPVKVGDTLGSLPETGYSSIETVGTADLNVLKKTVFVVSGSTLNPGEFLAFRYFRDATVGNADDTFANTIDIIKTSWKGYFWR